MQILLTKEITTATDLPLVEEDTELDPLFSWTVGWYRTLGDQENGEDTLIAFNNAARFVVVIYPVFRKDLQEVLCGFKNAIQHSLEAEHCNPELIESYLANLGEIHFAMSSSKEAIARLNYSESELMEFFPSWMLSNEDGARNDLLGKSVNVSIETKVLHNQKVKCEQPTQCLGDVLSARYGLPRYQFNAIAIECTLDLTRYKAIRNIVVPSDMPLDWLSVLIQYLYNWDLEHSHAFIAGGSQKNVACYMEFEFADPEVDECVMPEEVYTVSDLFGKDIGDDSLYEYYNEGPSPWKVDLHLTKKFRNYEKELPRQLSAEGQVPPKECNSIESFKEMLEVLNNPEDPRYEDMSKQFGNWDPELPDELKGERVITVYESQY